ncbi:MAG: SAM-dependent chlorinase/fluorinase [Acidothermales bacterium]|nr:SAM-dependent chlorinase/fluorinase [Acidothermales bacterium]
MEGMPYDLVTFTTDFGLDDSYVAICKAVLRRFAPHAQVLDVTHLVPPQDVRRGSLVLARAVPWCPPAVHLAVVDPGVGTARRAVAVRAGESVLVGPDNGLLPPAADRLGGAREAVALTEQSLFLQPVSATFQGRDVFSPTAGQVASGTPLTSFGEPLDPASLVRLPEPRPEAADGALATEVVDVDTYGNVCVAGTLDDLARAGLGDAAEVRVTTAGYRGDAVRARSYGGVPDGALLVYVDSNRSLELAVNGGSAARALSVRRGDAVTLTRP